VRYIAHPVAVDQTNITSILRNVDVIVDSTDNMDTKYLLNEFALSNAVPLVHVAIAANMGVVFNVIPEKKTPCLQCLYPKDMVERAGELAMADTSRIWNFIMAAVGALATLEVVKVLLNRDPSLELIYLNVWREEMQKINVERDAKCTACAGRYETLSLKPERSRRWGIDRYYVAPSETVDFDRIIEYLSAQKGKLKYNEHILHYVMEDGVRVSIFRDGHAIIAGRISAEKAKEVYDEIVLKSKKSTLEERQSSLLDDEIKVQRNDESSDKSAAEIIGSAETSDELQDEPVQDTKTREDDSSTSNIFFPNPFE
jgi:hypothetical protein